MAISREQGVRVAVVGELIDPEHERYEKLSIPPYQRPYSWGVATALQLLDDIYDAYRTAAQPGNDAEPYVLGAVILHRDEDGSLNVVDGQQRLLTLVLIRNALWGEGTEAAGPPHESDPPIVVVRRALERRVGDLVEVDLRDIYTFLADRCQVIRIETDDIDEAFRVFDSQNYRGKSLLPHDLLKAHHLREMASESASMKAAIVEQWESVPDSVLDRLFSRYLWRIHRWSQSLNAPRFGNRHLDVFKGVKASSSSTPFARYHLAAQASLPILQTWSAAREGTERDKQRARFQLEAPITAGRTFFEMVSFMLDELVCLRQESYAHEDRERFASSKRDLEEIHSKSKYRYVSELYLAAMLAATNKFGEDNFAEMQRILFGWAYGLRTRLQSVRYESIDKLARGDDDELRSAFNVIRTANNVGTLRMLGAGKIGRDGMDGLMPELKDFLDSTEERHD